MITHDTTKVCSSCGIHKDSSEFHKRQQSKDGLTSQCKECRRININKEVAMESWRKYRVTHREQRKEYTRKYRIENKETIKTSKLHYREQNKESIKTYQKNYDLLRSYNITLTQFNTMLKNQDYRCLICEMTEDDHISKYKKSFAVDHCHTTGKIRGLLCQACNFGLGNFYDNTDYLLKAVKYLNEGEQQTNG